MKIMTLVATALMACAGIKAEKNITLEDVATERFTPRGIAALTPLKDGESFARIEDGKKIVAYDFKSGKQIAVLFEADGKGECAVDTVEGYTMSPDEKHILIRTNTKEIYRRSYTATHYIYNMEKRTLVPLSGKGAEETPKWSPNGKMVGFVRDGNLFIVDLTAGNKETQVTQDGEYNKIINGKPDWVCEEEFLSNCSFDFNADNTMLAWIRYDESEVPVYGFPLFKGMCPEDNRYADYPGQFLYKYPLAGARNSRVSVHTYNIKSHESREIELGLDEEDYIPRLFFSSDADKLLIFTMNRHQDRLDVYAANPRSGECRMIVRDEVKPYITEDMYCSIHIVPDGFVFCSERDGWNHLYHYDLNGKLKKQVTKGEYEVLDFYGFDDATGAYYYSSNQGSPLRSGVYKTDARGRVTKLSGREGTNAAIFSSSFRYFVNIHSNLSTLTNYSVCDAKGKVLRVLEDNKALQDTLSNYYQGQKEVFSFKTSEGVELYGFMVKPADFDPNKRYPVVMMQYGGPGSQRVYDKWNIGSCGSAALEHLLAQEGFISVCVDGRGTGGRGADFEKQIYLQLGVLEARDQVETAIYLQSLPYVDVARIGIWGWSYGGFNTIMAMSEGRPVFAAGVAVAPPTSWRYYDSIYTERFMRTPKENEAGYGESCISRAGNLSGKLLICHGMADDNVHFRNTAEYVEALVQANKVNFKQLCFTNRNHFLLGGNTRLFLYTNIVNWFKENM